MRTKQVNSWPMNWLDTWWQNLGLPWGYRKPSSVSSLKKSSKKKGLSLLAVSKLYDEINDAVFSNGLTVPVLRITRSNNYFGKCTVVDAREHPKIAIYISGPYHSNVGVNVLRDTLAHEMIHQWQFENGYRYSDNHDETFTKWLPKVEEYLGKPLQNSWDET